MAIQSHFNYTLHLTKNNVILQEETLSAISYMLPIANR